MADPLLGQGRLGERLRQAREAAGLSQRELAERAGVPYGSYRAYEAGKALPGAEALAGLASAGIRPSWLLVGAGSLLDSDLITVRERNQPDPSKYLEVDLIDAELSAGDGRLVDEERVIGTRAFARDWVERELRMRTQDLKMCIVRGESMSPTLEDGDAVLVNVAEQRVGRADIYVLREDDALMVKRVERLPFNGIRILSDNPAYPPMTVMPAQAEERKIAIVGRVVWWAHTNAR